MKNDKYDKKPEISEKVVLITGGDSDIGKATATSLAKRGGKVYIACKDTSRGEEAVKEIKKNSGKDRIFFLQLDLGSLESIRQFSKKFHESENKLNILINNHEVVISPKSKTTDGFETNIGVNHLGHFLLTNLLLDLLKSSSPSRIIFESGMAHKFGSINKEDLMGENSFSRFKAYFQSKLATHLFAHELAKKLVGTGITVNISMTGIVITEIVRHITNVSKIKTTIEWIGGEFVNTAKEGAQTTIFASIDPDIETTTGKVFVNCKEIQMEGDSANDEMAAWLWKKSEELVGMSYV